MRTRFMWGQFEHEIAGIETCEYFESHRYMHQGPEVRSKQSIGMLELSATPRSRTYTHSPSNQLRAAVADGIVQERRPRSLTPRRRVYPQRHRPI